MNSTVQKILKIHWLVKQSLTKKPTDRRAKVSDLFMWRKDKDWRTFFELLDLPALFGSNDKHFVDVVFFDQLGQEIAMHQLDLLHLDRQVLDLSTIITQLNTEDELGTFAVFHSQVPESIAQSESWITERGYIGYQYKNAPLNSYVHGNYDAIAKTDLGMQLLGGESFLKRKYQLQFVFLPSSSYEVAFVNPCVKAKKMTIQVLSMQSGAVLDTQFRVIQPRALFVFSMAHIAEPCRIVVNSRMVMARPIVFAYCDDKMDVFHG